MLHSVTWYSTVMTAGLDDLTGPSNLNDPYPELSTNPIKM